MVQHYIEKSCRELRNFGLSLSIISCDTLPCYKSGLVFMAIDFSARQVASTTTLALLGGCEISWLSNPGFWHSPKLSWISNVTIWQANLVMLISQHPRLHLYIQCFAITESLLAKAQCCITWWGDKFNAINCIPSAEHYSGNLVLTGTHMYLSRVHNMYSSMGWVLKASRYTRITSV